MQTPYIVAVVDDDPDVLGSLDSLLRSAGMTPCCFSSADALLEAPARSGFACIVSDLHMPGMTGLELQAELRRRGANAPFILVTAFLTDAAIAQAQGAGAAAALAKPVDPDQLLDAIAQAVS